MLHSGQRCCRDAAAEEGSRDEAVFDATAVESGSMMMHSSSSSVTSTVVPAARFETTAAFPHEGDGCEGGGAAAAGANSISAGCEQRGAVVESVASRSTQRCEAWSQSSQACRSSSSDDDGQQTADSDSLTGEPLPSHAAAAVEAAAAAAIAPKKLVMSRFPSLATKPDSVSARCLQGKALAATRLRMEEAAVMMQSASMMPPRGDMLQT